MLCRPLLDIPKADLIALCQVEGIPFALDPTNENEKYLRPRLRAAREVLEEEGMTSKRLSVTATRLARARRALETIAQEIFDKTQKQKSAEEISFVWSALQKVPEEILLRVLMLAADELRPGEEYSPRMEKLESLMARLLAEEGFKSATLGGCLFSLVPKDGTLKIEREKP
jgi:tRNA(Ile)-lysidine synthase